MIHNNSNFIFDAADVLTYSKLVCNDYIIGTLKFNQKSFRSRDDGIFFNVRTKSNLDGYERTPIAYDKPLENSMRKIVILLESPSNEEYMAQGDFGDTARCWGKTGDNIRNNFIAIINNENSFSVIKDALKLCNKDEEFSVLAVNAIRYQCDIGNPGGGKNTRNIFCKLWDERGFKEDLTERLNIIKPDLIINCCTKEISKKIDLTTYLNNKFKGEALESSHHPCVWLNDKIKIFKF